jgi:DNA polymerase-3 subunit alpha
MEYGVKPILGCEFYVARTSRTIPMSKFGEVHNPTDHLVVLAETNEGYHNLLELATRGYTTGFHHTPRIDLDLLREFSGGLIGQTACLSGGVNRLLTGWKARNPKTKAEEGIPADYLAAKNLAVELNTIFGAGNFFLEVQNHRGPYEDAELVARQSKLAEEVFRLSQETGIPVVGTNDIHFAYPSGARAREVAMLIARNRVKKLDDKPERANHAAEFYFKNSEQMLAAFRMDARLHNNTLLIAERCNVKLDIGGRRFAQPVVGGRRLTDPEVLDLWNRLLNEAMKEFGFAGQQDYEERLAFEKGVIERMGFPPYFIMLWDIVKHAREKGIIVGPGRGSGAGCLIAYLLKITQTDSVKYGLLFERFLNPDRVSMPDLDIDFEDERIPEIMEYIKTTYGADRVCRIATFGAFWARGVIRNVGKLLGIDEIKIDDIANAIPLSQGEFRVTLEDAIKDVPKVRDLESSDEPLERELLAICNELEGIKSNVSTHACGVVIADRPITNYMAMMVRTDEDEDSTILQTQADMHTVESLGLLKIDALGLANLTVIGHAIRLIKERTGTLIDLRNIPMDDPNVFSMISQGRVMGLFQIESPGMREVILRIRPTKLADIVDTIALFRPGPNDAKDEHGLTMVDHYILRRFGREPVTYPHESVIPILEPTYGIIVYQEQIIKIVGALAGYTPAEADNLRRVIGKKKLQAIEKERDAFIPRAMKYTSISETLAKEIWGTIETFARYGFNKSHSQGYALITYWTAYLKRYYPVEFMCGLLTKATKKRNEEDIVKYIDECYRLRIPVYSPDITKSEIDFIPEGDGIRAGLALVKKVSKSANKVIAARTLGSGFKDFESTISNLVAMKVTKTTIEPLIACGAMDSVGDRAFMQANLVPTLNKVRRKSDVELEEPGEDIQEDLSIAESLDKLTCYNIPAYPITHVGLSCKPENVKRILEVLRGYPGSTNLTIRVIGEHSEVDLDGIHCEWSEHTSRVLGTWGARIKM